MSKRAVAILSRHRHQITMAAYRTFQQRSEARDSHAIRVRRVEIDHAVSASMQTLAGQVATSKLPNFGDDDDDVCNQMWTVKLCCYKA